MTFSNLQLRPRRRLRYRTGLALMLVVCVMAVAAVMGMAMLSMGAMQAQATNTALELPQLESLAASGVNLAIYYLQNPWQAGVASNSYWTGQTGITLGSSVSGTIDVTVASQGSGKYLITSAGKLNSKTKTIKATVLVNSEFQPKAAGVFGGNITFNSKSSITGEIWSNGSVTLGSAVLSGVKVTAPSGSPTPDLAMPNSEPSVVPSWNSIRPYSTYTYNGQTCTADISGSTNLAAMPTPSASNAGNVFIYIGNLNLTGSFTFTGTIYIAGGKLSERASNTITPKTGLPALICDNEIEMYSSGRTLTINGLAWVNSGIKGQFVTTTDSLIINGALYTNSNINSTYTGSLTLNYDATRLSLSDFSSGCQMPKNVKVLSWK
jgi:hypothetical protein